jgi:uncharacterized protein (DUF302 family)
MNYGFSKNTDMPYEKAVEKVTDELKKEGFGVLTSIDVKDTLKKKIDVDFKKYVILGACNPPLAHKALESEEQLGLLLPCNVIVYENNGGSTVAFFDPMIMTQLIDNEKLKTVAEEVQSKMKRVFEAV